MGLPQEYSVRRLAALGFGELVFEKVGTGISLSRVRLSGAQQAGRQ
jgi:hypothetical protein